MASGGAGEAVPEIELRHRSRLFTSGDRGVIPRFWLVHRRYYRDIYDAPSYACYKFNTLKDIFEKLLMMTFNEILNYNIYYMEDGIPIEVAMVSNSRTRFIDDLYCMKWLVGLNTKYRNYYQKGLKGLFWFIRPYQEMIMSKRDRYNEVCDRLQNVDSNGEIDFSRTRGMFFYELVERMERTLVYSAVFDVVDMFTCYHDGIIPVHAREWTTKDYEKMMETIVSSSTVEDGASASASIVEDGASASAGIVEDGAGAGASAGADESKSSDVEDEFVSINSEYVNIIKKIRQKERTPDVIEDDVSVSSDPSDPSDIEDDY